MRLFFILGLFFPLSAFSQINKDSIHFSGYTEIYFAHDQHNWNDHQRPDFLYSHTSNSSTFAFQNFNDNRMNGLNLSLAAQF
jgi:hypothetical protein